MIKRLLFYILLAACSVIAYLYFVDYGLVSIHINQQVWHIELPIALVSALSVILISHIMLTVLAWLRSLKTSWHQRKTKKHLAQKNQTLIHMLENILSEHWHMCLSTAQKQEHIFDAKDQSLMRFLQSYCYLKDHQIQNAEATLDRAYHQQPWNQALRLKPVFLTLQKKVAQSQKDPKSLQDALLAIRAFHGPSKETDTALAKAYLLGHKPEKVITLSQEGYLDPSSNRKLSTQAHTMIMQQYCQKGQYASCLEYVDTLAHAQQTTASIAAYTATCHLAHGDTSLAQKTLLSANTLNDPAIIKLLPLTYTDATNRRTAIAALEHALAKTPHTLRLQVALIEAYEAEHNAAKSLSLYQQIFEYHNPSAQSDLLTACHLHYAIKQHALHASNVSAQDRSAPPDLAPKFPSQETD